MKTFKEWLEKYNADLEKDGCACLIWSETVSAEDAWDAANENYAKVREIIAALVTLGITADKLLDQIAFELECGDRKAARRLLDFVDRLIAEAK